jgi:hypothetical protein
VECSRRSGNRDFLARPRAVWEQYWLGYQRRTWVNHCSFWDGGSYYILISFFGPHLPLLATNYTPQTVSSLVSPAEKAGVVSFKPTRHQTASHGLVPVSVNLDVIGPIAKTVKDIALIMNIVEPVRAFLTAPLAEQGPPWWNPSRCNLRS